MGDRPAQPNERGNILIIGRAVERNNDLDRVGEPIFCGQVLLKAVLDQVAVEIPLSGIDDLGRNKSPSHRSSGEAKK